MTSPITPARLEMFGRLRETYKTNLVELSNKVEETTATIADLEKQLADLRHVRETSLADIVNTKEQLVSVTSIARSIEDALKRQEQEKQDTASRLAREEEDRELGEL